ncbi:HAD-superfamily subfamily IB hydrolase, TIGR01490 [Bowdeniella nasicola]|uniref:HAD-superfamily subfamily IB hydrolase, TIGR01490 n=2 Tax=Bowdeniella nasicola TaxID=208480 RepID=A0A1H3WY81_9ACTO|nr:HAD-superfamily subfamily IB hydrolase, TIGR01490 [Bowdeniella nasicola]
MLASPIPSIDAVRAGQYARNMRTLRAAAFFDLDKTVLAKSATLALFRPLLAAGLLSHADVARSAHAQLTYHFLDADHDRSERVRERLSALVTGWDVAAFQQVVRDSLATRIEPEVFGEALDAIAAHHAAGHDVVIVSASVEAIVAPIAQMLGADHVVASTLEVIDGRYTGVISDYVYGPAKAEAMARLAERYGWDLSQSWAYSDSITDAPMLQAVGHPVAVNPDRALAVLAMEGGWDIAHFVNPVPLKPQDAIPLLGVLAALGAAGAIWWWWRRREPQPARRRTRRARR